MEPSTLLPSIEGLHVDYLEAIGDPVVVHMSAHAPCARCPVCGSASERIHSHYYRTLADLPWAHCSVRIRLRARKFFCDNPVCKRDIFTEPLPELTARYARKTKRLQAELYLIGYSLGGRAGATEADGLGREVGPDTLLRRVRTVSASQDTATTVKALGVDDWAFRKGQHYGTILVDLERHRVLDVLPDREAATLAAWLAAHPGVELVSRDRACAYAEAARQGAPDAVQVADRFHLLHNLVEAVQNLLGRLHQALSQAAKQVNPAAPAAPVADNTGPPPEAAPDAPCAAPANAPAPGQTRAQRESAWRREKRLAVYTEVVERHAGGETQRSIAKTVGLSRMTVRHYLRAGSFPERASRPVDPRPMAAFAAHLHQRIEQGCHNVAQLYREIREQGFTGTYQNVYRYLRRAQVPGLARAPTPPTMPTPSPRATAWLLLLENKPRAAEEEAFLKALCASCPDVVPARDLALEFFRIVHERRRGDLDAWMSRVAQAGLPELQSFANGLNRDKAAVLAALSEPWSNGQTEGQVNRLKLVKRSMYGRANFDLLRARVMPMAQAA